MIAQLPGFQLGYDDSGDGLPVVFLHGFPHDRTLWTAQKASLASQVRCILPDLRGFGHSSTHGPFSVDQYADDVVGLMDHLGIERAAICGLSMGGYVAMAMWRRHADRIAAMVFCDTKATADSEEAKGRRDELIAVVKRDGARAIAEAQLDGMVGSTTRARRIEVVNGLRAMMGRQPVAGIIGALQALRDRPDSRETIGTITVPSLVVVGEEDSLTPIKEARAIAELLPAAARVRLEIIASAGHVPCLERPAATNHALSDFFATLSM
ncbi:MAG TPA: alpha/beta hydrolase [Gemmatimonas aurantiaca]|uniref:Alpha/beta hydrolase n=2 Tax=Gemmatimonas aurantiaca TaxID=173480 RepID=A0A3D4V9X7_9BACT|nr:alpha/beta fold hydrolase [Gemmatimonas aurantiaca]BAH40062.1 putative hydrolase [Gemmatimonas aurantiaca T-27]HCT57930.1 alpha/beta hydrolase [Gemmatimonas aurantiaca]